MSEDTPSATTPAAGAPAAAAPPDPAKRELAVQVLTELFRLMDLPGRLEAKDAADGGISVALHLDGPFPGVQAGRRSHVVDAVQFLANKLVNRSGTTKRWISIGVGDTPSPPRTPETRLAVCRSGGPGAFRAATRRARPPPSAASSAGRCRRRVAPLDEESTLQAPGRPRVERAGTTARPEVLRRWAGTTRSRP